MIETLLQDVRYGIRMLRQSPTFALVAIGTLALGIGTAVGIFTVLNGILLRPLPVQEPDRLAVIVSKSLEAPGNAKIPASWTKYQLLRAQSRTFEGLGAYVERDFTVDPGDGPVRVRGARVTAGVFDVFGIAPSPGRTFRVEEDVDGAAPVAVITDAFWRGRLSAASDIIGKAIRIEGRLTSIVGVLPPGFRLRFSDNEPQVYLTCVFTPDVMTAEQIRSGAGFLTYVGRLRPNATFEAAGADLAAIDERYRQEYGGFADATKLGLRVIPFVEDLVGSVRPALNVLLGAVLFLLLIACANVAHLLIARAALRRREVGVRLAIGASHVRLLRQFLTEAVLLAFGGCVLGIMLAEIAVGILVAYGPPNIPRLADVKPDASVLAFAVTIASVTAVIFGLIPALRIRSMAVAESLRNGRTAGLANRSSGRLQQSIAISEAAVTVVLLIGAVLLFRSLIQLQSVNSGFDSKSVTTAEISLQQSKYVEPSQREAFFTEVLHSLQAKPGIEAVGATSYLPMAGGLYGFFFFIEGQPSLGVGRDSTINVRHVSADYFRAMEIPVLRGRA
ncbi:MAG: ABC transporter permease, partial [Acidobacteria bacterium]|nr:ABC transporter permease [Acidobacteriota bacterium]